MKFIAALVLTLSLSLIGKAQETKQETIKLDTMKSTYLGLRTVVYKVADLNEAKSWYTKAFEVKPYFDEPYYVGFNIGGYELGLLPEENPVTEKSESSVTYWGVEDVPKVFEKLKELGAQVHEEPHDVGVIVASVKDPWGNIIGIIYNPHFKLQQE